MESIDYAEFRKFVDIDFFAATDNFKENNEVRSLLQYGNKIEKPIISIMMPTYKRTTFLRESIESAINQKTNFKYEVVIVDNTTENDAILDVVKEYPEDLISYYRNEKNLGMFGNWNRCIELARAKYLVLLHDDDKLDDNYIEEMGRKLKDDDGLVGIGCLHDIIDENGKIVSNTAANCGCKNIKDIDFYVTQPLHIAGLLFSRDLAINLGGFSPSLFPMSDAVFIAKMYYLSSTHNMLSLNRVLSYYRVAENESLNPRTLIGEVLYFWVFPNYLNNKYHFCGSWMNKLHCYNFVMGAETAVHNFWKMNLDFGEFNMIFNIPQANFIENILFKAIRKIWLKLA